MKYWSKLIGVGLLIGIVLAGIQIGIDLLAGTPLFFDRTLFKEVGYNLLFAIVLTLINGAFFDYLNYRVVWKKYAKYRLAIGATGGVVLTMMGIFGMRVLIFTVFEGKDWIDFIAEEKAIYYAISLLITIVISVFFHAIYFYKALQEKKVKEQKVIAGTASAKFDALKNQLDPHFLFNSLNVLTSLIEEDPDQAQKFTTSLSKVYRYVLEQKNKDLVSIDEELQFAKTYVRLLKMRFEDSIVFDIPDSAHDPEAKIVPLSLQLLLENAVKHNVVTASRPLHIKVHEKDNKLVVSNNLQEKQVVKKSSGVGLRNIQQRYGILTDREVAIQKSASDFSVSLPMLTRQVSVMNTQKGYIEDKRYKKAKEKVDAIKGFYGNLISYCIVLPFLAYLNYRTSDFPWVVFPFVFWGLGVIGHGMEAYGYNPIWGKRWEEKKMRKFMEDENF
ncbi:2TM domain-containing protein [Ulvibacterium sp.]|uniref:2TM domain-containing protein n=1 Tax=Ulvibacterium sp. TaxID=2665914 RepID=UPI00263284E4|nr:2TM domain-containing protein [Ulvibacterium sp.]